MAPEMDTDRTQGRCADKAPDHVAAAGCRLRSASCGSFGRAQQASPGLDDRWTIPFASGVRPGEAARAARWSRVVGAEPCW